MTITIRQAGPADLKPLMAMVDAHNVESSNKKGVLDSRRMRAALFGKNAFVFCDLAELSEGGEKSLIGYALSHDCFTTDDGTRGLYLTDIFVESAWRREGAGRQLMKSVCKRAKRRGATHVWWASMAANTKARRFYATLGSTDEKTHAHALHGAALDQFAG